MPRWTWSSPEVIAILELHGLYEIHQEACNKILNDLTGKERGWSSAASKLMELRRKMPHLLDEKGRLKGPGVRRYIKHLEDRLSPTERMVLLHFRRGYPSSAWTHGQQSSSTLVCDDVC